MCDGYFLSLVHRHFLSDTSINVKIVSCHKKCAIDISSYLCIVICYQTIVEDCLVPWKIIHQIFIFTGVYSFCVRRYQIFWRGTLSAVHSILHKKCVWLRIWKIKSWFSYVKQRGINGCSSRLLIKKIYLNYNVRWVRFCFHLG